MKRRELLKRSAIVSAAYAAGAFRVGAVGTTYYVRTDGTQVAKANATVGGTAAQALSVAGFNGETFVAGDTIIFEADGTYTTAIAFAGTGSAGSPITIQGPSVANNATVNVTGGNAITITGDYLEVRNFSVTADGGKCFYVGNASGIGGYTVKVYDCVAVLNTSDDGFGTNATPSDASEVEWIRCEARAISGTNNQGFTNHEDQKALLTDCSTTAACETAMTMVGNECTVNGGNFTATGVIFFAGAACAMQVNDATASADVATTSRLFRADTSGTRLTFNDCTLSHLSPSTTQNDIVNDNVEVTFNGGSFTYSATPTSGVEWTTSGSSAILRFTGGVRVRMLAMGARLARTNTAGGGIICRGAFFDMTDVGGSGVRILLEVRNTSNAALTELSGCIFLGPTPASFIVLRNLNNTVSPIRIVNNVFSLINGSSSDVLATLLTGATSTFDVYNNVFYDCTDAIQGTVGLALNTNNYSGGTSVEGDASPNTSAPGWVGGTSPTTAAGFRLKSNSSLRRAGTDLNLGNIQDHGNRAFHHPPSIGAWEAASGDAAAARTAR